MRKTVSPEQKKFFISKGFIEFESLLSNEDVRVLLKDIQRVCSQSPGHLETNLFRSLPSLIKLVRKQQLGEIAYHLIEKKPVRLEYDQFFTSYPTFQLTEDQPLGLLLFLQDEGKGLFFKNELPKQQHLETSSYLLLIFTAKPLSNELNPIVFP